MPTTPYQAPLCHLLNFSEYSKLSGCTTHPHRRLFLPPPVQASSAPKLKTRLLALRTGSAILNVLHSVALDAALDMALGAALRMTLGVMHLSMCLLASQTAE